MLQIMCWVDPEDFDYLDSMSKRNEKVNYYGYLFEVEGGPGALELETDDTR